MSTGCVLCQSANPDLFIPRLPVCLHVTEKSSTSPTHSPDFNEDVEPIEEQIGNLGGESQVSEEVAGIIRLDACVLLAQFVVHKVLR